MYTKESLEKLRERIDLMEVIGGHLELKRSGATHKALCPFHQEKTPSFIVKRGDTHYHCFGCGAHGDAIEFLMSYLNLSFRDATESLAERFHVFLEQEDNQEEGVNRAAQKETCEAAAQFFHFYLLYTEEGREALTYLYRRGLTIDFIRRFEVGLAPTHSSIFLKAMASKKSHLLESGLLNDSERCFFRDRIIFPIRSPVGHVVGFSARKYKEATFGGKYINTPETAVFKKSRILFGLNFCRRRIAKERRAILVEGQIDCLKLIEAGLNVTVATLGTAFGESHVRQLQQLSVRKIYLLFDADEAGKKATSKVGHLLQKVGIEVMVIDLPQGSDPDLFLTKFGVKKLIEKLETAQEYLTFQMEELSRQFDPRSPAGKAELINTFKKQIEEWEEPVMVHDSLKKIASLMHLPEEMVAVSGSYRSNLYLKKAAPLHEQSIDPNRVLELDLLRWLLLMDRADFVATTHHYLTEKHFWVPICRRLFQIYLEKGSSCDFISLVTELGEQSLIDEILQKKINRDRAAVQYLETVQKLMDRQWMQTAEEIKMKIHSGKYSEEEISELAKQFDQLKKERLIAELKQ